jgi:hypothetical protein
MSYRRARQEYQRYRPTNLLTSMVGPLFEATMEFLRGSRVIVQAHMTRAITLGMRIT